MGLINEVNNVSQEIKAANTEKERREAERIKKQYEAKEINAIKTQTINFLKAEFDQYFKQYGSSYETEFLSIDRKNEILENCKKYILHAYNDPKFPLKAYYKDVEFNILIDTFNKNYYKILKEQKTIYINNEKYLAHKAQEEAEQIQTKQTKQTKKIDIWKILETTINIIIKIILVIIGIVFGLLGCAIKSVK